MNYVVVINPWRPRGLFTYRDLQLSEILYSSHRLHLWDFYASQNKHPTFSCATLSYWLLYWWQSVYCAVRTESVIRATLPLWRVNHSANCAVEISTDALCCRPKKINSYHFVSIHSLHKAHKTKWCLARICPIVCLHYGFLWSLVLCGSILNILEGI